MKKQLVKLFVLILFASTMIQAQGKYSIGLVSSNLVNLDNDHKISNIESPFGYGFVLGAKITKEATVAATFEYLSGDAEDSYANVKDYRGHISVFVTPMNFGNFYPYFSGGAVVSSSRTSLNGKDTDDTQMFARFGVGVDYKLLNNFGLNFDLGIYSNGLKFNGLSNSIGFRFVW